MATPVMAATEALQITGKNLQPPDNRLLRKTLAREPRSRPASKDTEGLKLSRTPSGNKVEDDGPDPEMLRKELLDVERRVKNMDKDFTELKEKVNMLDMRVPCMACGVGYRDVVLQPCGHVVTCTRCSQLVVQQHGPCPLCQTQVANIQPRMKTPEEVEQILNQIQKEQPTFNKNPPTDAELRTFRLEEVFHHFDADGSGFIDKQELYLFMKRFIYQGLELSEEELLAALDVVDTNKDGKISPEEFMQFMETLTSTMSIHDFDKAVRECLNE